MKNEPKISSSHSLSNIYTKLKSSLPKLSLLLYGQPPSAESEIREELNSGKHKYQLNRSYIIGAVSRYVRCLKNMRCYKDKLQQLIQRVKNVRSIIRPDRHFKRKVSHHGITNGFCIRINL